MTWRLRRLLIAIAGMTIVTVGLNIAASSDESLLSSALQDITVNEFYPNAEYFAFDGDGSKIARAEASGRTLGYVFVNSDFVDSTGYSGKPIDALVAIDTQGVIQNVKLIRHYEPIVLAGIPESRIIEFVEHLTGLDLTTLLGESMRVRVVDAVSGATVTTRVIDDSVVRSAFKVASLLGLGIGGSAAPPDETPVGVINREFADVQDWLELISDRSVTRLKLDVSDVSEAFARAGLSKAAKRAESDDPAAGFIELFTAPVSVPSIGLSLLGKAEYNNLLKVLEPGQQAVLLMGRGLYSYKGSGYVRGGIFDRFELVQGEQVIRFVDFQNKRLRTVAAEDAPAFNEIDLFYLPADSGFDITRKWHIDLLVGRAIGPTDKSFISFSLNYQLPEKYLSRPVSPAAEVIDSSPPVELQGEPLWKQLWLEKLPEITALSVCLIILTGAFFFQDWLVKRGPLLYWGRIVFLFFTLFGIGFYANAQLSVVNIITVFNAFISGFSWSYFLMEPLIFILWGSVIIGLLFWGRGPYCGWLCPFGALQELLNKSAKALNLRQVTLPWGLHERLWSIKYIIFLGLFGVSLHSLAWAEYLAEVEPFKTVIILKFAREWPFVALALVLLLPTLFIERFYCRYLCPLGAALAIPARLRMFEWLKRYRRDCGQPCQTCSNECMVGAIHPQGHINPNECHYCMHCQKLYHDEHVCPVMVAKRKKREKRARWIGNSTSTIADIQIVEDTTGSATKRD